LVYRRPDGAGRERIPATGPVLAVANHHNSIVDAMQVVMLFQRPVMVLANAPLFRHPLIGPFLRMMHAVPVSRRVEAGDDPKKNEAMFAAAIGVLRGGGVLLIFPEGRTQPQPTLLPVRTGAARILLGAEPPAGAGAAEQALSWRQRVMRGARYLAEREPHRVAALRRRVELYCAHLDEVGVPSEQLGRPYTPGLVVRYVVENLVWLALGLPLALWGLACHALPYWLTGKTVALLGRTAEEEATDKMAAGLVLYPMCWALEGWLVWRLAGLALFLTFLLAVIPSGVLALAWRERLGDVGRQARAF